MAEDYARRDPRAHDRLEELEGAPQRDHGRGVGAAESDAKRHREGGDQYAACLLSQRAAYAEGDPRHERESVKVDPSERRRDRERAAHTEDRRAEERARARCATPPR